MRQVLLDGRLGPHPDPALKDRLTGHLHARLAEYGEEGIAPRLGPPGQVLARFDGYSGQQAVQALARRGVTAQAAGEEVCFHIGPGVTFEDLDWVQAAAADLLM